ncbi:hypothetical protein [Aquabacterium sp.]|uniref:hypothetical protein n=1 Tax=Aquabacterium sp. TaxID=1872578 RepID=UPI0025C72487|nr:hypothetical protein [Aquabacterium sp.]
MRHFTNEDGPEDLTGMGETSGHNGSFRRFNAAEQGAPAPCPPAVRERLGALRLVLLQRAAVVRKAGQGLIL